MFGKFFLSSLLLLGAMVSHASQLTPEQQRAVEITVDWVSDPERGHGAIPIFSDYGPGPKQIPLDYHQLTSSGPYAEGQGTFASAQDYFLEVYKLAKARSVTLPSLSPFDPMFFPHASSGWQNFWMDEVINFVKTHDRPPQATFDSLAELELAIDEHLERLGCRGIFRIK